MKDHRKNFNAARAPIAEQHFSTQHRHGVDLSDTYAWMRAENWQQVLRDPATLPQGIRRLVMAENEYADDVLANTVPLQKHLLTELRARMEPEDSGVPMPDGEFAYYSRFRDGGQHPLFCRQPRDGGTEQILVDGDTLAKGKTFFDLGDADHAPDHALMWWSADDQGSEFHTIHIRDLATGADLPEILPDTDGQAVWSANSKALYYVKMDENHRPMSVWQHRIGASPTADRLIYEENDSAWFVSIHASLDGLQGIITIKDHDSTECRLLDLTQDEPVPRLVATRRNGLRYDVVPHGNRLFARTNVDGAEDFKIAEVAGKDTGEALPVWQDFVPHRAGCLIVTFAAFKDFVARLERENGLPRIIITELATGAEHSISFEEEAYSLYLDPMLEFNSDVVRFAYSSMTTPTETYDYNMRLRTRILRKRQIVPSGHNPADYVTRRVFATAHDGKQVPVTLLYKKTTVMPAPVLLYAYGAYGYAIPASFSTARFSLVDRGFVYAIAHVRGGMDKGYAWYAKGKLEHKTNTFKDFISSARHLISAGITRSGDIVAQGGSAGGMLMGAIANMAPELFAGIIADVPFVDVLNTMLDASLPLTPPEWLEWGNPIEDKTAFERMRAYSPYDNVRAQAYPPILALAGLTDPRVTYWEPLKWVARLRATITGGGPILLKTNMDAGHAGAAGRFDQLEEVALCEAFALACCDRMNEV